VHVEETGLPRPPKSSHFLEHGPFADSHGQLRILPHFLDQQLNVSGLVKVLAVLWGPADGHRG